MIGGKTDRRIDRSIDRQMDRSISRQKYVDREKGQLGKRARGRDLSRQKTGMNNKSKENTTAEGQRQRTKTRTDGKDNDLPLTGGTQHSATAKFKDKVVEGALEPH